MNTIDDQSIRALTLGIHDALMIGDATQGSVSEDQFNRSMARAIVDRMATAGEFGNSLTRYKIAEYVLETALQAYIARNYLQVGDGRFSLRQISEEPWAQRLGIVAKPDPLRSVLTLTAGTTIRSLIANGSLVRIGHRYQLGDLRSVLGKL